MAIGERPYSGYTYLDSYGLICASFNYNSSYRLYVIYNVNGNGWSGVGSQMNPAGWGMNPGDYVQFAAACHQYDSDISNLSITDYLILDRYYYYPPSQVCTPPYGIDAYQSGDWVNGIVSYNSSEYYVEMYCTVNGVNQGSGYQSSMALAVNGLNNGDRVCFYARCKRTGWTDSSWVSSNVVTVVKSLRPNNFYGFTMRSGDTMPIEKINDTTYYCYPVSIDLWNSFTSRINEFRKYKGYGTYTFSLIWYKSDFTAALFNEAGYAIITMLSGESVTLVQKGDNINASNFIYLQNKLNSIT